MSVRSYQDLEVWQKATQLVVESYQAAKGFPPYERFGLAAQMQRAAVSVASNIAEGHERDSSREFLRHISIARGSLAELETQFEVADRLGYATAGQLRRARQLAQDVGRMLSRVRQALLRRARPRP